ncbi:MAG TPA: trypsin-like peptidase domain-containing protein [Ktedonobacterales bacterium]|nr:trypsin-like peptidase domain-containing protein [Ktedonobacterales bacterium]
MTAMGTYDAAPLGISEALSTVADRLRASVVQVRAGRGGIGTGVIWQRRSPGDAAAGEYVVVTNEHVVRAAGSGDLAILLEDGRTLPAQVADHDPEHDLALLTVQGAGLQPAEVGDSAALRVGELVLAMGNPFGKLNTLTMGIVAARAPADPDLALEPAEPGEQPPHPAPGRHVREDESPRHRAGRTPDLIQADVALYPGNSGGPLTDAQGRVVGINSMVGGGLAFAIPSRIVQQFIMQSATTGGARPQLGVQILDVELPAALRARAGVSADSAVLVGGVEDGGPAALAGILTGDIIVGLDGHQVRSVRELVYAVRTSAPNGPWTVRVVRGGERREITVRPVPHEAAA